MKNLSLLSFSILILTLSGCSLSDLKNTETNTQTENTNNSNLPIPQEISLDDLEITKTETPKQGQTNTQETTQANQTSSVTTPSNEKTVITPTTKLSLAEKEYNIMIADTKKLREIGLMNQTDLKADEGMLFIFDETKKHKFWMKNTLIPLDIIWLNEQKEIVDYLTAEPCTQENCDIFEPIAPAKYVLELNADSFRGYIGDQVSW